MNKQEFYNKLKDPLKAEASKLDKLVESMANGNKVETIPGRNLMYITIFFDKSYIQETERRQLEFKVKQATEHWWMEACTYTEEHSQLSFGFRAR